MDRKDFGDSLIAVFIIVLIVGIVFAIDSFIPSEEKEPFEVYNFLIDGEVVIVYDEPANLTLGLKEGSWVNISQVNKILHIFINVEPSTVMISSQLQIIETDSIWSITITGVTANTSKGFIECQGLEQVSFLPPRTLITIASFDFLKESYFYKGQYHLPLSLPSSPEN